MQRLGRLAYSFSSRTAGQGQSRNRVHDAASGLPLPHSLIPIQELLPAYYSSTLTWNLTQASILTHQQHNTTSLQPIASPMFASQASAATVGQQAAPASASNLIAMLLRRTMSQLGPAAAMHWNQIHTSASKQEPSPLEPHSSKSVPQPEPAARQSGPDISLLNAVQQRQWDHARNAHLGHILVKPQSHRKAYWICTHCPDGLPHRWEAQIDHMFRSSKKFSRGCPYCSGHAVCAHNSLARKAPHLSQEWDTTRNNNTPNDYTGASTHHAHWVCAQGHQWQASIQQRVVANTGCPDCFSDRRGQKAPLLTASSGRIMQIWDHVENYKAGFDPSRLTCGSSKRAHFKCPEGHQWMAVIENVSRRTRTSGCPQCSGRLKTKCT